MNYVLVPAHGRSYDSYDICSGGSRRGERTADPDFSWHTVWNLVVSLFGPEISNRRPHLQAGYCLFGTGLRSLSFSSASHRRLITIRIFDHGVSEFNRIDQTQSARPYS